MSICNVCLTRSETETLLAERGAAETASAASMPARATIASASRVTAPRPVPESSSLAGLSASYAAQVLSSDFPIAQRVGVDALLGRYRGAGWLAGFAAGEYQFPLTARTTDIGMQLQTISACAGVEAGHLRGWPTKPERFAWRSLFARLGAGVDFDRVSGQPGTRAVAATLSPAHWSSAVFLRAAAGTSFWLGRRVTLDVRLFADLLPTAVHYDVSVAGDVQSALSPWRVRPGLAIGLALR